MKLKDYLNERSTNLLKWCKENSLPYFSVRHILKGKDCFLSTAIQIEEATKGKVTCKDLKPKKILKHLERLKRFKILDNNKAEKTTNENTDS